SEVYNLAFSDRHARGAELDPGWTEGKGQRESERRTRRDGEAGRRPPADRRAGTFISSEAARDSAGGGGTPGEGTRSGIDAQVRGNGVFADRQGFELLRTRGEIPFVPGL